jgi:AcrR family transcriptional regulator
MFTEKGYRRALMTDVAARLELSHALLYRYVESKEALFELALRYAMDPDAVSTLNTPLATPPRRRTLALVKGWANKRASFPVLGGALRARVTADVADELGAVIDELYRFFEDNRRVLGLVERSAPDIPELYRFYFLQRRRALLAQLADYLGRRMASGNLQPASDLQVAARFLLESVVWFAWHRKDDPDSAMIGDEQARRVVRELLLSAFVPPPSRRRRP